jgi:hypothetical protein
VSELPAVEQVIEALGLSPHPEGGYYREVYRSGEVVGRHALPDRYGGDRAFATSILFLLTRDSYSALHRLASDEVYHLYLGGPLDLSVFHPGGTVETVRLGRDVLGGEKVQHVVPRGAWQGSRLVGETPFALMGCTVAPGFEFADFEMADRAELLHDYPEHQALVRALTRG